MKLSHAVFVYPRIELNYIKEWLDYHEKQGVDHVYMTLHLNEPRDKILDFSQIVWTKKPNIPYVKEYTENELVDIFKEKIRDHINRDRITLNFSTRLTDTTGKSHRLDQRNSYKWAQKEIINKQNLEYQWLLVSDVDEFFVPENPNFTMKQIVSEIQDDTIGSLRCWCVIHPSRYDYPINELPWNIYIQNAGQNLLESKYVARCQSTEDFALHWSLPKSGYSTVFNPSFNIHHFRGFDDIDKKGRLAWRLESAWPKKSRKYFEKKPEDSYIIYKVGLENKPTMGPTS
jgi:hypothetical protein